MTRASDVTIRRLRADEGLAYRALRLRALEREPAAFAQTLQEALADPEDLWHRLARSVSDEGPRALFVADRGDGTLGGSLFVGVSELPPHVAELGAMWVDEDLRAQGVADELVRTALAWALRWGAEAAVCSVSAANARARRFFARHGFAATGEGDGAIDADGAVELLAMLDV